jgi:hypothetical protein
MEQSVNGIKQAMHAEISFARSTVDLLIKSAKKLIKVALLGLMVFVLILLHVQIPK